ncbi:hypothetical protein BDQ17DRAFT_1366462 [Cyathus striatus]|nr:hypothetical protein BDQ17DRAFT_1366462 [Cyathus striatus]
MPRNSTIQPSPSTLPSCPSKLVDCLTFSDSQYYERAGMAMNLTDIKQVETAIQSLEPDPIDARHLFQQIEHEDAEARPLNPPPQLPLYPSEAVDYMALTEEQLLERVAISLHTDDMNYARKGFQGMGLIHQCPRMFFQDIEHGLASALRTAKQVGRKPRPGEEVIYADLKDDVTIRLYRGDLEGDHMFSFDFVYTHDRSRHRRRPANIVLSSRGPFAGEITSLEQNMQKVGKTIGGVLNRPGLQHLYDAEWETFVVPEGTIIDLQQGSNFRTTIQVPSHSESTYVPLIRSRA